MKISVRRRLTTRFNYLFAFGILALIAVVGLALPAVQSSSVQSNSESSSRKITSPMTFEQFRSWSWLSNAPTVTGESISLYASDCATPKTVFSRGEIICAKTNGVDLSDGTYNVNWIDSQLNITNGGTITTNPQTFLFAIPTDAELSLWKGTIGRTGHSSLPDDTSIIGNPPLFTVEDGVALATFAANCTTPKTAFVLGDTVCVRVAGLGVNTAFPNKIAWADTGGWSRQKTDINSDPKTDTFQVPSSSTSMLSGGITVDNRGTWRVSATRNNARRISTAEFSVSDPQQAVADVFVQKFVRDSNASFASGSLVAVRVLVGNKGPDTATNILLTDVAPSGSILTSFIENSPGASCLPANTGNCTIASLASGAEVEFTAIYDTQTSAAGEYSTSAGISVGAVPVDTNLDNNSFTARFTIIAGAAAPQCSLVCPTSPAAVNNAPGQNGATVDWNGENNDNIATASGNCGPVTYSAASPAFFAIGATPVTATTESGETCTFFVTVNDNEAPVMGNCPANITVTESTSTPGEAVVNYSTPSATDNSGSAIVTCSQPAGSSFTVSGSPHTVTCTATDESGNTDSCQFTVTVNAANENCTLTPPANITEDADANQCGTVVTYSDPTQSGSCGTVTCDHPSGSFFGIGTTLVTCHDSSGASTSFNVTVNDTTAPVPNIDPLPTLTGDCSVTAGVPVVIDPPGPEPPRTVIDLPKATDNCSGPLSASTQDERTYTQPGTYVVNWTYTDGSGNMTTQQQTVIVTGNDNTGPVPDVATLPTVTDECEVTLTPPTATDNCAGTVTGTTANLTVTGAGTHTVVWTYDDGRGNTSQQNQTVVVTDTHAPTIALVGASSITVECHTSFTDPGVTTEDNCVPKNVTVDVTGAPDINVPNTYTVTYTATDGGGNEASVQRTVVVVDTIAPVIALTGASPLTVECHTPFTDPGATASDSCDTNVPVNVSGTVDANVVGTYTLVYTAADDSGNAATSVSRTVNVVDTTAPTISCPANIVVYLPLNSTATSMPVSFTAPTASDTCDASVPVTTTHASGSVFSVGSTAVTASTSDDSGNAASCTFTVTVLYNFAGFFSPVNNPPTFNNVNAGRAIPIKFSLSGDKGLNIFAAGYPVSQQIACDTSAPLTDVEGTITTGGSTLTYSPDQYHYSWKTDVVWLGTCRVLTVKLNDGSEHTAFFKFK